MGAKLFLVSPVAPGEHEKNLQKITDYLSDIIPVEYRGFSQDDLIELWYWFDRNLSSHRLVVWGDFPAGISVADGQKHAPADFRFFYIPAIAFRLIIGLPSGLDATSAADNILIWVSQKWDPELDDAIASGEERDSSEIPFASASKEAEDTDIASPSEAEWTAVLGLVRYFDRIPVVSIPRAAAILGVDERTIRNRIADRKLEGIPKAGATWVSKRSIKAYLKKHYHPTTEFDLWKQYVEPALVRKAKER